MPGSTSTECMLVLKSLFTLHLPRVLCGSGELQIPCGLVRVFPRSRRLTERPSRISHMSAVLMLTLRRHRRSEPSWSTQGPRKRPGTEGVFPVRSKHAHRPSEFSKRNIFRRVWPNAPHLESRTNVESVTFLWDSCRPISDVGHHLSEAVLFSMGPVAEKTLARPGRPPRGMTQWLFRPYWKRVR